jgi:hypothetical protein
MPLTKATQNPVFFIRNHRRFSVHSTANSSGGASASGIGGFTVNCGTTATAYGKVAYNSAFSQLTQRTGAGIDLISGVGLYGVGLIDVGVSVSGLAFRVIVGDDAATVVPAVSTSNAISTRGFGFEVFNNAGTRTVRLFAHDGTTYSTSSGLTSFFFNSISLMYGFWVKNDSAGNVYLYMSQTPAANTGPLPEFAGSPVLIMTGGPTANTSAKRYVTFQAITDGVNNPASANAVLCQFDEVQFTQGI